MEDYSSHETNSNHRVFQAHRPCCSTNGGPCPLCMKILQLESRMEEARKGYDDMVAQHCDMKARLNSTHDPITRQLPTEVVSHIFYLSLELRPCSDLELGELAIPEGFDISAPLKLGAVCSLWRKIAWSTPQLWTYIAIRLNASKFPARANTAFQWLKRSGGLPLHIHMYTMDDTDIPDEELFPKFSPLIKAVNACSNRWRVLDLEVPLPILRRIQCNSSSSLTPLSLQLGTYDGHNIGLRDHHAFSAPNLTPTEIGLWGFPFRLLNVGWTRLTTFFASGARVDELIKFLAKAPLLSSCTAECMVPSKRQLDTYPLGSRRYAMLKLLHLDGSWTDISDFIKVVDLPALQDLGITTTHEPSTILSLSFLKRFSCHLTRLTLQLEFPQWRDIISLLHEVPTIVYLNFIRIGLFDNQTKTYKHEDLCSRAEIFEHIAGPCGAIDCGFQATDNFLPNLKILEYSENYYGGQWERILPALVASTIGRDKNIRQPLDSVTISLYMCLEHFRLNGYINKNIIPGLVDIIREGFSLAIHGEQHASNFDVIEESMKFHQFEQEDIEEYLELTRALIN